MLGGSKLDQIVISTGRFNRNKYHKLAINYLYRFFSFILFMDKGKSRRKLFDILEDDQIVFTLENPQFYRTDSSEQLVLGEFIETTSTEIILGNKIKNNRKSPSKISLVQKREMGINVYLDNILKECQRKIDVPIKDLASELNDYRLEQCVIHQISETTIHELIHRDGQIEHEENCIKTPKNLDKAGRILDYFIYVNTHRDQIVSGNLSESNYLFLSDDFWLLPKKAAYDINLEMKKLRQAFKKLKPSSYDPDLSDDILKDKNFTTLLWEGYISIRGERDKAIESTMKQFKIGYLPGFDQQAFRRFLNKGFY